MHYGCPNHIKIYAASTKNSPAPPTVLPPCFHFRDRYTSHRLPSCPLSPAAHHHRIHLSLISGGSRLTIIGSITQRQHPTYQLASSLPPLLTPSTATAHYRATSASKQLKSSPDGRRECCHHRLSTNLKDTTVVQNGNGCRFKTRIPKCSFALADA